MKAAPVTRVNTKSLQICENIVYNESVFFYVSHRNMDYIQYVHKYQDIGRWSISSDLLRLLSGEQRYLFFSGLY